jgi:hypothetical protein
VRLLLGVLLAFVVAGAAWAGHERFGRSCDASSAPRYARRLAVLSNVHMGTLAPLQRRAASDVANGMGIAAAGALERLSAGARRLATDLATVDVPRYKRTQRAAAVRAARRLAASSHQAASALRSRDGARWRSAEQALSATANGYDVAIDRLVYTRKGCPNLPQPQFPHS